MLKYKGYTGATDIDYDAGIIHGRVLDLRDVITFQGTTPEEVKRAFEDSIDDYLEFCAERGEQPEKPFSGNFVVRVPPDLHKRIAVRAALSNKSLNQWAVDAFEYHLRENPDAMATNYIVVAANGPVHGFQAGCIPVSNKADDRTSQRSDVYRTIAKAEEHLTPPQSIHRNGKATKAH